MMNSKETEARRSLRYQLELTLKVIASETQSNRISNGGLSKRVDILEECIELVCLEIVDNRLAQMFNEAANAHRKRIEVRARELRELGWDD
jgi:hypothetical protein